MSNPQSLKRIVASKISDNKYPLPSYIELDGTYIDVYMRKPSRILKFRYSIFELRDMYTEENNNGAHTICIVTAYGLRKFEGFTVSQCQKLFDEIDMLRIVNAKFGEKDNIIKKLAAYMFILKTIKSPDKTEIPLLGALIDKIDEGLALLSGSVT